MKPPRAASSLAPRPITLALFGLAGALLAAWLWHSFCRFPSIVWNDVRLAPTIALAQGWPIFPTASSGTINTWTYGPLPPLYYWPASLATSASGALMIAAALNLLLTLGPIALVCFGWPAEDDVAKRTRPGRWAALLLCLALWPPRHYEVIFADNLGIACGLIGNLLLLRSPSAAGRWLAAAAACAAVGCKQIAVGVPLAQVLWLGLTAGGREALKHTCRLGLAGLVLAGLSIGLFGAAGLRHVLWELPASFPWAVLAARLQPMIPEALWQIALPAVVMLAARRRFARPDLLLPALAWACTLPFGILALLKTGGWLNSLYSLALWLPPVLTWLLTRTPDRPARTWFPIGAATAAALIGGFRLAQAPQFQVLPATSGYVAATEFADRFRGRIWFPFHPLVTLYSEHRYYHDEDGLHVRRLSGIDTGARQLAEHLPPAVQVLAFHNAWSNWGVARSLLPPDPRQLVVGDWTLWLPAEKR
jgi:hypothetical protein